MLAISSEKHALYVQSFNPQNNLCTYVHNVLYVVPKIRPLF